MGKNKKTKPTEAKKRQPQTDPGKIGNIIRIILVLAVLFLYGNTLNHEFVLDDDLFIKNNPVVNEGAAGISQAFNKGSLTHFKGSNFQIYRPAQISLYCIEFSFFGMNAGSYHFISLLLYGLLAIVVFNLLRALLPKWHIYYHALIALIFITHPVHTEVVANIKSQDELLAAIGCLSALLFMIKAYDGAEGRMKNIAISLAFYLLALFSKESSFAFVVIFPISLFLLRRASVKESIIKMTPFAGAGIFFLLCRHFAIRESNIAYETSFIENVLYAAKTTSETIGTKLGIAFYYIKLMLIPYPLSWDYSFNQIPIRNFTDGVSILSLALYLSVAGLIFYYFKKQPVISFGLIFFMILITPTANVFFINGTTFADRFLFLPSFGFILAVVLLIMTFRKLDAELPSPSHKNYLMIAAGIILSGFGYLTIKRNADWSSNYAVFKSGALNSPNSSRTNDGLATTYMNIAQETSDPRIRDLYVDSSIRYYQKSLEIYPDNNKSSYSLGFIYAMQGQKDLAIKYYRQSIASKPDYTLSLTNLGSLYANMGNNDSAYYFFTRSIKANPNDDVTLTNMCIVSLNLGKTDEAIQWGEKVISMGKGNQKIYNTLSLAYERKGDMNKALEYRMKN